MEIGAAPETTGPALVVEIGWGTRAGGGCPARSAARNGDTSGASVEEAIVGVVEVVEAAEIVTAAAAIETAAEDIV